MPPKKQRTSEEQLAMSRARARHWKRRLAGKIKPEPCWVCGAEPAELHHIDYDEPERVMWLCTLHHRQTHSQFGRPAPADWMADIRAALKRLEAHRRELGRLRPADPQ